MESIRQILLARRPEGAPQPDDFRLATAPMPRPGPGEMLVRMRICSLDPAIRGFLDDRPSYLPPVAIGAPVNGMSLGEVVESNDPAWPVGTLLRTFATWSDHYVINEQALGLERVRAAEGVPIEHYMGALGPVGLTAWVGLFEIGQAKAGDTVLVSAAAGATGSTVVQLAKAAGCRVIGLAGSAEKCALVRELGADVAIDYRAECDLGGAIAAAAPEGLNAYFDNVGGETLDVVLPLMAQRGRVALCGMVAQYNHADRPTGITQLWQLVVKRVRIEGFLTYDHLPVLPHAQAELERLFASGELRPVNNLRHGFERLPEAFIALMSGQTSGKTLVVV